MHSFTDCALGAMMGAVIWAIYWVTEDAVENWLIHAGWSGQLHVHLFPNQIFIKAHSSVVSCSNLADNGEPTSCAH
jgi:hypothetical protein